VAGQPQNSSQHFRSSLELQLVSLSRLFCPSPPPSESLPESRYKNPQHTQAQTGWTHATVGFVRPHRLAVLSIIYQEFPCADVCLEPVNKKKVTGSA
jgi:hypothetical protein